MARLALARGIQCLQGFQFPIRDALHYGLREYASSGLRRRRPLHSSARPGVLFGSYEELCPALCGPKAHGDEEEEHGRGGARAIVGKERECLNVYLVSASAGTFNGLDLEIAAVLTDLLWLPGPGCWNC